MRFGSIYDICRKRYNFFQGVLAGVESTGYPCSESGLRELFSIADEIQNIMLFSNVVKDINKYRYFLSNPKKREKDDFDILIGIFKVLEMQMNTVIVMYESIGLRTYERIGLDIKLPAINDLTDFKHYIDDLEFIFTKCPFLQSKDEKLKFYNVDIGSTWLLLGVAGASIAGSVLLNNIAAFIDKCYIIRSHQLTCEKQEQEIEKAKLDQKEKDELVQNIKKLYKIAVDNVIKELEENTEIQIKDGDDKGRTENSIEKMNRLLDKGLQIYSAIDSPSEVKALFKPLEMHYLSIEEKLKIEKKKEDEE